MFQQLAEKEKNEYALAGRPGRRGRRGLKGGGLHDIQPNYIQYNNTEHNDIQHKKQ